MSVDQSVELKRMAEILPSDNPKLTAAFERLCLVTLDDTNPPAHENIIEVLLGLPVMDAELRLKTYHSVLNEKEIKEYGGDYYGHASLISATVDAAQNDPKLTNGIEELCMMACTYRAHAMNDAGIEGLKVLHKGNPQRLLKQFDTILTEPKVYKEYAAFMVTHNIGSLFSNLKPDDPIFKKAHELSVKALVHECDDKNYVSRAQESGLDNLERWILNVPKAQHDMFSCDEDAYTDVNGHLTGLQRFETSQTDQLAGLYLKIVDNNQNLFSKSLRETALKRSIGLVAHDKKYAPMFEAAYIKKAVEHHTSRSRYIGWDGLIASGYDIHRQADQFRETALTVCDPILVEASLEVALADFKDGCEIQSNTKPVNKKLWNQHEQKLRDNPPPKESTVADKAVLALKLGS